MGTKGLKEDLSTLVLNERENETCCNFACSGLNGSATLLQGFSIFSDFKYSSRGRMGVCKVLILHVQDTRAAECSAMCS